MTCQLPAARATATTWCHDLMIRWCDSLIGWLYDGVLVGWPDVKVIVVVVIARAAATGDDDGDRDSNSANVGLAAISESVAFLGQGEPKEALASIMRAPPRVQ